MTSRLMTTAACMLAILSAVCASHAAEMAQVSARRAVTEGSQGLYRDLCCESHHHVPTLVELLSGVNCPPKTSIPHSPHSCVAQVAVRSPSHTDLILERPPSLSRAPLASLLSVFSPRPRPLPARDARLTLRLLLRYREPPQLSAPCVSRLDLTMGRGRRARKTNFAEEKATTTVSTKCPDCLSTYDAHEQSHSRHQAVIEKR